MRRRKVTTEIKNRIIEDRKQGMTYEQLSEKFGISISRLSIYLSEIEIEKNFKKNEKWKEAEKEAEQILKNKDFINIINLNEICAKPFWDYYAERNNEKWLIDVTMNTNKNITDKYHRTVEGYVHAILWKIENLENNTWKLIRINCIEI